MHLGNCTLLASKYPSTYDRLKYLGMGLYSRYIRVVRRLADVHFPLLTTQA